MAALESIVVNLTTTTMMMKSAGEKENYTVFYKNAQFVTGLICYPLICFFGLTGNIVSLVVLNQKKMITSTNVFLSALAVADIIKLLNDVLYFIVLILFRVDPINGNRMHGHLYPYAHYIFNEAVCVTAWLTVSVAVERYIAVCHPTKAKEMCTVRRARIVSTVVFIVMSLLAVPSAMKYKTLRFYDNTTNMVKYDIGVTELGRNESFMTAYTWLQNLLRSVVPLVVLIILNACIIHALRKSRIKGKKMSSRNRITLTLIIVIIVFSICITPDAIMSTIFNFGYYDETNLLVRGIREITDMLLAINSAVNFIIYCTFSKVFRDTFLEIMCSCPKLNNMFSQITPCLKLTQQSQKVLSNGNTITTKMGSQTFV